MVRAFVTEAEQTWKAKKSNFYLLASVKTPKCDACSSFSVLIVVSRTINTQRPATGISNDVFFIEQPPHRSHNQRSASYRGMGKVLEDRGRTSSTGQGA